MEEQKMRGELWVLDGMGMLEYMEKLQEIEMED